MDIIREIFISDFDFMNLDYCHRVSKKDYKFKMSKMMRSNCWQPCSYCFSYVLHCMIQEVSGKARIVMSLGTFVKWSG